MKIPSPGSKYTPVIPSKFNFSDLIMTRSRKFFSGLKASRGLTLIEIVVVGGLIAYVSILAIKNFSATRIDFEKVANVIAADVRLAQQLSLSAHQLKGPTDLNAVSRCGYGITSVTPTSYNIYAGPPSSGNCGNPKYNGTDQPYYNSRAVTLDSRLNFYDTGIGQKFGDIFFMPPGPTVYLENSVLGINQSNQADQILVKLAGVRAQGGPAGSSCQRGNPNCIYICVYGSGRVEVVKTYGVCP
jgi:Tfp pilus assembly protein FimT